MHAHRHYCIHRLAMAFLNLQRNRMAQPFCRDSHATPPTRLTKPNQTRPRPAALLPNFSECFSIFKLPHAASATHCLSQCMLLPGPSGASSVARPGTSRKQVQQRLPPYCTDPLEIPKSRQVEDGVWRPRDTATMAPLDRQSSMSSTTSLRSGRYSSTLRSSHPSHLSNLL